MSKSLLNQLKINSSAYKFSNDLFNSSTNQFAFYAFNNGFGYLIPNATVYYDNLGNDLINPESKDKPEAIKSGKAYLQQLFQDYLNK